MRFAGNNHKDLEPIGRGGFGEVYKAVEPDGTIVAVKYLKNVETENLAAFQREISMLVRASRHRHIVSILYYDVSPGEPYYKMEYCEGGSLRDYVLKVTTEESENILRDVSNALAYVHSLGGFHRDVKPDNILFAKISGDYYTRVSDFGLGRLPNSNSAMTQTAKGTIRYMAPELFEGYLFTQAADVYSLGITIFEILTGSPSRPIVNFDVPSPLLELLLAMTETDPHRRPTMEMVYSETERLTKLRMSSPIAAFFQSLTPRHIITGIALAFGAKSLLSSNSRPS